MDRVRRLEKVEWDKARELWEEIFPEDSPEFLDAYQEIKRENRIDVLEAGGRVIAMVHWNPYEMCYGRVGQMENRVTGYYIVGVATRMEYRHQGCMRTILCRGMEDLRRSGLPFVFLMPADEAIYAPLGFRTVYEQTIWKGSRLLEPMPEAAGEQQLALLCQAAGRVLKGTKDVYCIRDETYFRNLIREMGSEDGRVVLLGDPEAPDGYYCCWPGDEPEVREIVCPDPARTAAELGLQLAEERPKIMIRLLDLESFVRPLKAEVHTERYIHMEDPVLVENTGDYRLIVDKTGGMLEELTGEPVPESEKMWAVTPEEMTDWMFGRAEFTWGEGLLRPTRILLNETV